MKWLRRRIRHLVIIARYDSTAFAELASGLLLLLLRGLLLMLSPKWSWPLDVSESLYAFGLDEQIWGTFVVILGCAQILVAGSTHHTWRLAVTVTLIASFVFIAVTYSLEGYGYTQFVLGSSCLVAFWLSLLVRIFHDRTVSKHHERTE